MSLVIETGTNIPDLTILEGRKTTSYVDGECLYYPEDPSGLPLVIAKGAVRLSALNPRGKELTLGIMRPPEIIIDGNLLDGRRSSYAYAMGETTVIPIPFSELRKIPDFDVLNCLLTQTARQLGERINFYRQITTQGVRERLATLLLHKFDGQEIFATTYTQYQISTVLGASRESTNINLKRLRREGIIDYRRLGVVTYYQMLNPEELMRLAGTQFSLTPERCQYELLTS